MDVIGQMPFRTACASFRASSLGLATPTVRISDIVPQALGVRRVKGVCCLHIAVVKNHLKDMSRSLALRVNITV